MRSQRSQAPTPEVALFLFDLASPESYLVAERVERTLGDVDWIPVDSHLLRGEPESGGPPGWTATPGSSGPEARRRLAESAAGLDVPRRLAESAAGLDVRRRLAESAARERRLPLVWPERFPAGVPGAQRAAAWARELGAGASFALAAFRLAFCGGFDLEDPEALAEAAAAAGLSADACVAAAGELWRDEEIQMATEHLRSRGVLEAPAIRTGGRWFTGESGILGASAAASSL